MGERNAVIGAILGDIIGSKYEFCNIHSKNFTLLNKDNYFTDDSVMTLAIANALLKAKTYGYRDLYDEATKQMQKIGVKYPYCGYGGSFARWVLDMKRPEPYNSFGNGAAMRVSPVAYVASDLGNAERLATIVTLPTHNHPEGVMGAVATAGATYMALQGSSKEDIREYVEQYYKIPELDSLIANYFFNETCQNTVPEAFTCFFESEDFEDCMRTCISIGGDSDTLAAIAGSVAGAYYGVPDNLAVKAEKYLTKDLLKIYKSFKKAYIA